MSDLISRAGNASNFPPSSDPLQILQAYHASMYRAIDALLRIPQTSDGIGAFIRSADYVDRQLLFASSAIAQAREQVVSMVSLADDEIDTEIVAQDLRVTDIFGSNGDRPAEEGGAA